MWWCPGAELRSHSSSSPGTALTSCPAPRTNSTCSTGVKLRIWPSAAAAQPGRVRLSPHGNGERDPAENVLILPEPTGESGTAEPWAGEDSAAPWDQALPPGPFPSSQLWMAPPTCWMFCRHRALPSQILDVVDKERPCLLVRHISVACTF